MASVNLKVELSVSVGASFIKINAGDKTDYSLYENNLSFEEMKELKKLVDARLEAMTPIRRAARSFEETPVKHSEYNEYSDGRN